MNQQPYSQSYEPRNDKQRHYALLAFYSDMPQELYKAIDGHNVWPLYGRTVLKGMLEHSPYLIELKEHDALIAELPQTHLLLFSAPDKYSKDDVLDHLRNRMKVTFDSNRKGIFHYYQPEIASYFFLAERRETQNWMGILSSVSWLNQVKAEEQGWRTVENELDTEEALSSVDTQQWVLTASQAEQLNRQWLDRFIEQSLENQAISATQWQNLRLAYSNCQQLAVTDKPQIQRYFLLVLADESTLQLIPQDIALAVNLTDQQKIDLIENRFKENNHVS